MAKRNKKSRLKQCIKVAQSVTKHEAHKSVKICDSILEQVLYYSPQQAEILADVRQYHSSHGALMLNKRHVTNVLLFVTGWIVCLSTSRTNASSTIALATTLTITLIHLKFMGSWEKEKEVLLITLLLGSTVDSFAGNLNLLEFSTNNRLLPSWMACVWVLAGTTLRHGMTLCQSNYWRTSLAGFLFGLVHYFLIHQISDVALSSPVWLSILLMAIIWSILAPVLMAFSTVWLERYKRNNM